MVESLTDEDNDSTNYHNSFPSFENADEFNLAYHFLNLEL